ncbi:cobW-domain-containing protein [Neoconidiobolus thromboides FSU 785]|nr:cobW-domain-containing protein [Neoconidiobolus thromboides FSU 785]
MSTLPKKTAVTVFTGFLGAGKTTILISLLKNLNKNINIAILKNEFGDSKVDNIIDNNNPPASFKINEIINGCLCCVLIGQLKTGLLDLKAQYNPDLIIIETSGSAFPAPIAWQIKELSNNNIYLDAIITVIDCVNFMGYEDTSYTAKLQAQYTDLILLNKWQLVGERELDLVIDKVNELNEDTARVKVGENGEVDSSLVLGIHSRFGYLVGDIGKGDDEHHFNEVELILIKVNQEDGVRFNNQLRELKGFIKKLSKEDVYRVKGIIESEDQKYLINFAFQRGEFTLVDEKEAETLKLSKIKLDLTVMGQGLKMYLKKIKHFFEFKEENGEPIENPTFVKYYPVKR